MYIAIEGNIGAGKSTVIEPLAEALGFEVIHEGVETDEGFKRLLAAMYESGCAKPDFDALQDYLAEYRANIIRNLDPDKNYIMERSLQGAVLFCIAENHSDTATRTLMNYKDVEQPAHYVLLDCPPFVCSDRIAHRGRECEQGISLDYLQRVDKAHRDWGYMGEWAGQVTVVDSSMDIDVDALMVELKECLQVKGRLPW